MPGSTVSAQPSVNLARQPAGQARHNPPKVSLTSAFALTAAGIAVAGLGVGLTMAAVPVGPLVLGVGIAACLVGLVFAALHLPGPRSWEGLSIEERNRRTRENFVPANLQYPGVEPNDAPDFDPN